MARGRQETLQASGVIEAVARTGKSFKIGDDWYGAFHAKQLKGAQKGDEVEFDYVEVVKGGATFNNIEGDVRFVGDDSERDSAPARRSAAPARGGRSQGASSAPSKAVGDDPRQRSIVRQNSLTQANMVFSTLARAGLLGDIGPDELAEEVVRVARTFEQYSMVEDE